MDKIPLSEIQKSFLEALYGQRYDGCGSYVVENGITAASRMKVYRNNMVFVLTQALLLTYPAINRFVGDDFFRYTAGLYLEAYPSRSGNLDDYGEAFAGFLASFPPLAPYPFLPDLARLEWAWHQASVAANAEPFDFDMGPIMPEETYAALRFHMHPSLQFLTSPYRIDRLYTMGKENADIPSQPIDLAKEGIYAPAWLVLLRPGLHVMMHVFTHAEYDFLTFLKEGKTLYEAFERTKGLHASFSLDTALYRLGEIGVIVKIDR